jgi:hypothetical protein
MAIHQELLDFNKMFRQLSRTPVIVNDLVDSSVEEKERLKKTIYTYYDSDTMSTVPTCECEDVVGEFNIGVVCENCKTACKSKTDNDLESILWMRSPHGVEKLINPTIWSLINTHFKLSGFEFMRWIADSSYKPAVRIPKELVQLEEKGITRGYNYFVKNFDAIMYFMFNMKIFKRKEKSDLLGKLLTENREKIFSDYIPLPNRSILIVESSNSTTYVDSLVIGAINAIHIIASVDSEDVKPAVGAYSYWMPNKNVPVKRTVDELAQRNKENRAIKAIHELSEFYESYYGTSLASKEGLLRRQVYGTRANFSFRAVISSITDAHCKDDVYIPWAVGIGALRLHLLNKLTKMGYTSKRAIRFLNESIQKYNPLLDKLFQELIAESPYGGIPIVLQRNPSLERGSAQALKVTKIKTNVNDPTISMSILIVVGFNAKLIGHPVSNDWCESFLIAGNTR